MEPSDTFGDFVKSYQAMVFATAVRLLGSEADAADIAQEVFLKAHERFEDLQSSPRVGGWLKTVTTNLCLNHLTRYRARWRFFSEMRRDEDSQDLEQSLPDDQSQDERDELEYRRFHLDRALRRLPSGQRVPLVLYHFEDMSYEKIAQKLGVSLSKVKIDIYRARQSLRRWLNPVPEERFQNEPLDDGGESTGDQELKRRLFAWPHWSEGLSMGQS